MVSDHRGLFRIPLLCLSTWTIISGYAFADPAPRERPNVVLIISDDQTFSDFGFMGNDRVHTPHLDRLAAASARYTHGYVPASVCRPSLVTLLTGLYPHQHGVHFNHPPPGFSKLTRTPSIGKERYDAYRRAGEQFVRRLPTLPRLLAKHGYRCFQTGKFWEGHWRNAGFTEGMTIGQPSGGANGDKTLASGEVVAHGNGDHGLVIGRQTMEPIDNFIADCEDTPFFLWYAPFLPHMPHNSPNEYFELAGSHAGVADYEVPYFASIAHFDDTVGKLLDMFESRGIESETLFVFVVDNGWQPDATRFLVGSHQWDHTKRSKRAPFDAGLRTPILFRWDGKTVSRSIEHPVSSIDVMPTILDAVDIEYADLQLPGQSLFPEITGATTDSSSRSVFGAIYPGDASQLGDPRRDVAYRWIRKGAYKLIVPVIRNGKPPWNRYVDSPALFNLVTDPHERQNVVNEPGLEMIAADLARELDAWWTP